MNNFIDDISQKIDEILDEDVEYQLLKVFLDSLDFEETYNPLEIIKIKYRKMIVQKRIIEIKKHHFEEIKHSKKINPVVKPTLQKTKKIPILQQVKNLI